MHSSFLFVTTCAAAVFFKVYRKFKSNQENKVLPSSSSSFSSLDLSSPPSSLSRTWKHDVFPSFHGGDVRKAFLSHILDNFRRKGIDPFIDTDMERSKSISPELIQGIRGSKIAIVLLSKNYTSSSWCLDELVEIMKCRDELGQIVMPIFYEVDPTDVKKQTGYFGKVFKKTCAGKTEKEIKKWKKALEDVATIAGEHSRNWDNEAAMVENIATDISNMLNNSSRSSDFDGLVGMRAHMENMEPLLCLDSDQVRMIGIWGPLGIGKTTIARYLFSQHSHQFQLSVFMENIRVLYPRPCYDEYSAKLRLQKEFLSQTFSQKVIEIPHLGVVKERLNNKKVLVILDDVDRSVQLDAMAKEIGWFGPGSRIIITTEDRRVLKAHGINHIYKVGFPPPDEALQIFCMSAFGQRSPKAGFHELAQEVTKLAGKLPLGLKVMGSYFQRMSKQEWTDALPRLRSCLDGEIESILKFSYDTLCNKDKDLFLHIACFFNNDKIERVEEHLVKKFPDVKQGFRILAEKSLISFSLGYVEMHNLLVQLGKEIVSKQSLHEPRQRQFLIESREICEVLTDDADVSKSVIGIDFRETSDELCISERAFQGMYNLQFLRFYSDHNRLHLPGGLNYLSRKLRLLHWDYFPMRCLPSIVNLEFLVEIKLCYSQLEKLWEGTRLVPNLKWMDLSWSVNLRKLPDLSTATNLKELSLARCSNLVELPSSLGNATNLKVLCLFNCSSLVEFPSLIGNVTNLKKLDLNSCTNLVKISSIANATNLVELNLGACSSLVKLPSFGTANSLRILNLSNCSNLVELPSSIGNATNLEFLDLSGCWSLVKLPFSIGNATNLQKLDLKDCSNLVELPSSLENASNLTYLDLSRCLSLVELPSSIGKVKNLTKLYLCGCSSLVKLPFSIGNATNLQKLDLKECSALVELPSSIGNAISLVELDLSGCLSLMELPYSVGDATDMKILNLSSCSSLVKLHFSFENATNLQKLDLKGCSNLMELPLSIGNATNLKVVDFDGCSSLVELAPSIGNAINLVELNLNDCSNLVKLPSSIGTAKNLKKLYLTGCSNLVELPAFTHLGKGTSTLQQLVLNGCRKLVSIPQLPDSLEILKAEDCESLKILHCSFQNTEIILNFANCFKLNKEAKDLIIHTSPSKFVILPGGEVPTYFTHRAIGGSVAMKLNGMHFPTSLRLKACISLVYLGSQGAGREKWLKMSYKITDERNGIFVIRRVNCGLLSHPLKEHLLTFEFEADVTSSDLVFEFKYESHKGLIKQCGVLQLFH